MLLIPAISQSTLAEAEQALMQSAKSLMMADTLAHRQKAFEELTIQFQQALKIEHAFDHPFDSLKTVSILMAPDSAFRIFSYQLYLDEDHYQYGGIIQKREDPFNPVILTDRSDDALDLERDHFYIEDWYGAVYYSVKSFTKEGKTYYALFGFDAYQMFENRKVADIMHFEGDEIVFGAPVFVDDHELVKKRLVVQYSADVSIKLNFDEDLQLIIFDNLIPMKSPYRAKKIALVTDGSYRGYQLDQDGHWRYIDKIFHATLAEPPRDRPVLDAEADKDIFGKKKNRR